jgi:hypothetical protein
MPDRRLITAAEMDAMTPQERSDAVVAGAARAWDEIPEPFRSEVLAKAAQLTELRRKRD